MDVQRTLYREDHELFRTAVRRFIERDYLPRLRAGESLDRQLWLKAGREGLLCVTLAAQFGGGGDFGHAAIISEEFARAGIHDRSLALHSDTLAPCVESLGSDEQKQRWLPAICSGQAILALAVDQTAKAVREGDTWRINGSTCTQGNAGDFDLLLLACQTAEGDGETGLSLIMVERSCAGLHCVPGREHTGGIDVRLLDVCVPVANLLGAAGKGQAYLDAALSQESLLVAIFSAAYLEQLLALTLEQAKQADDRAERPWNHPATRRQLADIKAQTVALRLLVDHYLLKHLEQPLAAGQVAIAAVFARQTLNNCAEQLLHLLADSRGQSPGPASSPGHWPLHEFIADAM